MACKKKVKAATREEFYESNRGTYTYEKFSEEVYILVHTAYISITGKIKPEMGKIWTEKFGVYMTNESFEYMVQNEPVMLIDVIMDQTRHGNEINSGKYLEKSLVGFEFDLWLIENSKAGLELNFSRFKQFMLRKYGRFLDDKIYSFNANELNQLSDFAGIAKALTPFYSQINETFQLIVKNNRMRINFEREDTKRAYVEEKKSNVTVEIEENNTVVEQNTETSTVVKERKETTNNALDVSEMKQKIRKELEKEFGPIIKDKEERIEKLEKDIKEFKRQRDESREYSANQYDRGIRDLFALLNDPRYGKVIDYFYSLLRRDDVDENLVSYLDNFFMALEDMEIEPIVSDGKVKVKEETMMKNFNMDFDKSLYNAEKVELKYAGWKYKEVIMEKPTLTLKED